jgi:di/tricarboxylate transporter
MIFELTGIPLHTWGLLLVVLATVVVFLVDSVPVDVTAMGVLLALLLGGYVSAAEAFSGFSSPVVIVMVCTLFVSGALRVTGVSDVIARWIQRYAGSNERIAIAVVMLIAGLFSAFMNNVSAAALMMPAVAVLSHDAGIAPSRLFIPLAYAVTIGGMLTLIGTPPNILSAEILRARGLEPFHFFDFSPFGLIALAAGTVFMVGFGYKLLPIRKTQRTTRRITDLRTLYALQEKLFSVRVPDGATAEGKSLTELRFGSLIGGVVVTIIRGGRKLLSPKADEKLHARDVLLVRGNPDRFEEVLSVRGLSFSEMPAAPLQRLSADAQVVRFTIKEVHTETRVVMLRDLLRTTGIVPLAVERVALDHAWEANPPSWFLDSLVHKGDVIVGCIAGRFSEDSTLIDMEMSDIAHPEALLAGSMYCIRIEKEGWSGAPLHRLIHETKLPIVGAIPLEGHSKHNGIVWLDVPVPELGSEEVSVKLGGDHILREGEMYLVSGSIHEARRRECVSSLKLEGEAASAELESTDVGIVELILTPRSEFIGKTLADLHFREKYECQVVALWRDGKPHLSLSSSLPLVYGDALLVQGPRSKLAVLAKDPDFLLLSEHRSAPKLSIKSAFSLVALLMLMFLPLVTGMPIYEAAFLSACVVVFSGAITTEQAYREIEWRVVFLLAMIIPLGAAVEKFATLAPVMEALKSVCEVVPPIGVAALLLIAGSIISQLIDASVAVIFLGPVALSLGQYTGISPRTMLMALTLGSSLSYMLPTSCRSNILVMGAGGYKASDFMRIGAPFSLVVGLAVLLALGIVDL